MNDIKLPLRIFSVDPATTLSGWALLELISINPLKVKVIRSEQINGDILFKELKKQSNKAKLFSRQYCIVDALEFKYLELIKELEPDEVVSESAFGYTHMSVIISLTLAINSLRKACDALLHKDITTVPPTISKRALTGSGGADKDAMRKAYYTSPYLIVGKEDVSEHEIDAAAHGLAMIRRDIVGDIVQISAADKRRKKREKEKAKLTKTENT